MIFKLRDRLTPARKTRTTRDPARAHQGPTVSFEALEQRQLLAVSIFDSTTGELTIDFETTDTVNVLGTNAGLISLNGNTDLDDAKGNQTVEVGQVSKITINGRATSTTFHQTLIVDADFSIDRATVLEDFHASNLNEIRFDGKHLDLAGDLLVNWRVLFGNETTNIFQSSDSNISVSGLTGINIGAGDIDLSQGTNHFGGPINVWSGDDGSATRITGIGHMEFQDIQIAGTGRFEADSISDVAGSIIDVQSGLWLKAHSIVIGDNVGDSVTPRMLNFKSTGNVDISTDANVWLIGSNFAKSASLTSSDGLFDAVRARTNVAGPLQLTAAEVNLGDTSQDRFNAATLSFYAKSVDIVVDGDALIVGKNSASQLTLTAAGAIANSSNTGIIVLDDIFLVADKIDLGNQTNDYLSVGRLNFNAANQVSIGTNGFINLFGENTANKLALDAGANRIFDEAGTIISVDKHTILTGGKITLGHKSTFTTGSLTVQATGNASIFESDAMILTGLNFANSFRLGSTDKITNDPGTSLNANFRLDLAARAVDLGGFEGDEFMLRSLRFTTVGEMSLKTMSSILMVLDSHAESLNLRSAGDIGDQPDSEIIVEKFATLTGTDIILGDSDNDCFDVMSDNYQINAGGLNLVSEGCAVDV